jgi:hypothetical protein
VLKSFLVNTKKLLEEIENVSENTLDDYATIIHGIKGSSRGVCAEIIGSMAEMLENASNAGDFQYVKTNSNIFISTSGKFIAEVENILQVLNTDKPIKNKPALDTLSRLRKACEKFDMNGVEEAMAKLETWQYNNDDGLVKWLRERVDMVDFKGIIKTISRQGYDPKQSEEA